MCMCKKVWVCVCVCVCVCVANIIVGGWEVSVVEFSD